VEELGTGFRLAGPFPDGELEGELNVVPFEELLGGPATRVIVRSAEHTPQDFLELTERIGLHGVNYAVGWTAWLDLAPDGVSKATALEDVRRTLDIDPSRTLAVGDGRNDVEMLQWAARSVAMGHAPPEVQECADEVAAPVTEDGLADVLESVLTVSRIAG
jgi:hydroxymethylpyrimidine pyrophosphatase-like HAD family hydrolase